MEYKIYTPCEELSNEIKYYWSLEDVEGDSPHSRERIFPDGCIELLFDYGNLFLKFLDNGTSLIQPRGMIHGQITKFIEIEATGKIGVFSVRFHPDGLQAFVNFDVSNITDDIISIHEVWPEADILEEKVCTAKTNKERILIIEEFLLLVKKPITQNQKTVRLCIEAIIKENGIILINDIIKDLALSQRQLERMFQVNVGLSLKTFSRIVRFNYALQLIEKKDFSNFTSVAHEGGFYDQAHFIKDFKELTGLNPKQYFSENLEMVKFFNL